MKKKIFIIIATIILAVILSALIFTPVIARKYINNNSKELIGRSIHLEKIRVDYFNFTFRFIGFKLFEKDDSTVFTGFDTLLVDLQPLKLFKSELSVKRLWLINPNARITKRDTVFNFSDIIDFFSTTDTTAVHDSDSAKTGYKFEISDIRVSKGRISYTDEDIDNTTLLNNFGFSIPYLSWNQKESSHAGLKFDFRNGGNVMADGTFSPGNGDFNSKIVVNNLDVGEFSAYIKPYIYLNSISGLASCTLDIKGKSDLLDSLSVKGRFSINSFSATDKNDRKIVGVDSLNVSLKTSLPMFGRYIIDTFLIAKPYLMFEMHDSSNNFIELFPHEKSDSLTQVSTDSSSQPFFYSVNSLMIRDGIIDFADITLKEPFKYHFSKIKLSVDSVSSNSSWLTAYSTMKLNERGDLKAEVGINPSDPYELKIDYVISNFRLPDISPYSKFYLGSAIVYGDMYYTGKTSITSRKITSDNKLIIRNAKIGKRSGGIFNIPLRLALYLIKDLHGDIKIDLPVSGDLNDPTIKIGRLIWTTFKNLIVKIAATPFIELSNLFGVDQKDLEQLDFNYSDTLLSETNLKRLDQLLQIKQKKPELNIELAYINDRSKEKEQLGFEEAGRIFNEQTGGDYLRQSGEFEAFIKRTLVKDTIDLYNDCIKLAGVEKIDMMSKKRDDLRVRLIEDHLISKDTLSQIKILVTDPEAIRNVGSKPVFEIKFSMEE
ncbi:MAG TPA: DUF748 domain-containing protein [Bacteroidales bacterium]|nr:DUF748 domain-containing protein [Bacteroidales bacterium]